MSIRKFLLTSFDYIRAKDPNISLASSSIMALLKAKFETGKTPTMQLYHRQYNVKNAEFATLVGAAFSDIEEIKPDVIATGVYVWNEAFITPLFEKLQQSAIRPKYVIFGGPQITYSAKGTLENYYPNTDFFIRGYGEESLLQLLTNLQISKANLSAKMLEIDGVHMRGSMDRGIKSQYKLSELPSPLLSPGLIKHKGTVV